MKLGTLNEGGRDGILVVVSPDLTRAVRAASVAETLQAALDDWAKAEPGLREIDDRLRTGNADGAFDVTPEMFAAPLPRCFNWSDGSVYLNHMELVRKARGAEMPETFLTDPLMYQGGSDDFQGCRAPILAADTAWGIDFEAEIGVFTDDVPMGCSAADAAGHIKLVTILNDVSLRNLIPGELAKGFGFYQGKPATAFAAVAVTPDELGNDWRENKLHRPLTSHLNGEWFGSPDGGVDMNFDFAQLVAHAARTRRLGAGTVVGSGTVSNRDRSVGSACIAEKRMIEIIEQGEAKTSFMDFGDRIQIDMTDAEGRSIFGSIDQTVTRYDGS